MTTCRAWGVLLALALLSGCRGNTCARHSDCASGEVCELGECVVDCDDDGDCPVGEACNGDRCGPPSEAGPPECAAEAGCPDAATDASVDVPDGSAPDGTAPGDAGVPDAAASDAGVCGGDGGCDAAVCADDGGCDGSACDDDGGCDGSVCDDRCDGSACANDGGCDGSACIDGCDGSACGDGCDGSACGDGCDGSACANDGGCDASACGDGCDASLLDALPPDAAADLDALPPDAGAEPDAQAGPDALPPDAAPPEPDANTPPPLVIDLTGIYAVTRTVRLSNAPDLAEGDEIHEIVRLTLAQAAGRPIYRLDVLDPMGQPIASIRGITFFSPGGRDIYQFSYTNDPAGAPEGCTRQDFVFERGRIVGEEGGPYTLGGQQDLDATFEGDGCDAEPFLVRFQTDWLPLDR